MPQLALVQPVAIVLLALAAAWSDLRSRTIRNWLCVVTACMGLAFAALSSGWTAALWHGAHMIVALCIGMALFAMRWWGGGDGKFYAAVAAWAPLSDFFTLTLCIALAGALLVTGAFLRNRCRASGERGKSDGLPYGVAISAGILCTVLPAS